MGSIRKAALLVGATGALLFGATGVASADSNAYGAAYNSPGVLSGNVVQIPVDIPINVCGNSINVIGLLNPAFGNSCSNGGDEGSTANEWHATHWGHPVIWKHEKDDCN
ncbi:MULTISPECIES: chaplin [Streptacidiphilus]|uniref:Chaplin n=2 Tax=Streptacidiphilus TaxID=228398 RepID=A0ABV6UFU2_9ACTN|nr:chaplin [Streptacidiphilus jeojiense]